MSSISDKPDPVVLRITVEDVVEAFGKGLRDFQALPLYDIGLGAVYAIGGLVIVYSITALGMSYLGACPSNRCSNPSESDSSLDYEQALSPLEYRSDAASAAECAGLRAQGPRLAVYRWAGAGESGSQG